MSEHDEQVENKPYPYQMDKGFFEPSEKKKQAYPFKLVIVYLIFGLIIGYFMGARSIGDDLLNVQNSNRDLRNTSNTAKENLHTAIKRLDDAKNRMGGELFPNYEAIRQVESAVKDITLCKTSLDEMTNDMYSIVDSMETPWSVQLLLELGLIQGNNNYPTDYDYGL